MKVCPYCHKDLPDDSVYCIYCGRPIEKITSEDIRKARDEILDEEIDKSLKENKRKNYWSKISMAMVFGCLICFDFIGATVMESMGYNSIILFYISFLGYMISIILAIASLVIDYNDKKNGYQPNGNKTYAWISIIVSFFIALINLFNVIL